MKATRLLTLAITAMLLAITAQNPTRADDTERFFAPGISENAVQPNVLFVLDTSGSMNNTVSGTGKSRLENLKDALRDIISNASNLNMGLMTFHRLGGPVRYPVADLDALAADVEGLAVQPGSVFVRALSAGDDAEQLGNTVDVGSQVLDTNFLDPSAQTTTVEVRVNQSTDDGEERVGAGSITRFSGDLEMSNLFSFGFASAEQLVGMRFRKIDIPQGAEITHAELEFVMDEDHNNPTTLFIEGEATDDAGSISSNSSDISSRPRTNAKVTWAGPPSPNIGQKLISPDISAVIQEIVCRGAPVGAANGACTGEPGNWQPDNDMFMIVTGTPGSKRVAESFEGGASLAPLLRITYASGGVGAGGDQLVGLRFGNVEIPQGATITSANLEFAVAKAGNDPLVTRIRAQDSDDAAQFVEANDDLSNRPTTAAFADWDLSADPWGAADVGAVRQSVDISALVQEVVNRTGWCGGNALAFVLETQTPGLVRALTSYDGDPTLAPALRLTFDPDSSPNGCLKQTLIRKASDDAEEGVSSGSVGTGSSDLEMTQDAVQQLVGIRFSDLPLPKNAVILDAFLRFTAKDNQPNAANLSVAVQDIGNAPAFLAANSDISNRTTFGSVGWAPPPWFTGQVDETPSLTALVQHVVDRTDWNPGNDMAFIISGSGRRRAWSVNGSAAQAPTLVIKVQGSLDTNTGATVRDRLLDIVDSLDARGGTPIVDTLYEAAHYYRGENVDYGAKRGDAGFGMEFTRVSHPASWTGGTISHNPVCDTAPNDPLCRGETITGNPVYKSPINFECGNNYIVLLSDGEPTVNTSVSKVEALISGDTGAAVSCAGSGSGKCGPELTAHLHTFDQARGPAPKPDFADDQFITTHTIGFNLGAATQYMQDLAAAGGGDFFEASTAGDLVNVFDDIITSVIDAPTSAVAASVSTNAFNRLASGDEIYLSLFRPDSVRRWDGNIKKYRFCQGNPGDNCTAGELLDMNGTPATDPGTGDLLQSAQSFWSTTPDGKTIAKGGAGENIPSHTFRNLYTYTDPAVPVNEDLTLPANAVEIGNTALTETLLGVTAGERDDLIRWIRGQDIDDEDADGDTGENRWIFADPMHSSPQVLTFGCVGGALGTPCTDTDIPVSKLIVGGNDGAIRLINSDTGDEEWAFIPQTLLALQKELRGKIQGPHLYGVDVSATVWREDKNEDGIIDAAAGDFVRVFFAMRRGGNNVYALDLTPPSPINNLTPGQVPVELMWRIEGGTAKFSHLSQSWSQPQLAKIRVAKPGFPGQSEARTVLIFGGGYDPTTQDSGFGATTNKGNAIYIVDALTGERLWWASKPGALDGSSPTPLPPNLALTGMDYPIPADTTPIDSNGDSFTNRLYVGDNGGQVWRIDLGTQIDANDPGPGGSSGGRLAILSTLGTPADERKFFHRLDVAQVSDALFSDVPDYDLVTIASGNRAHPLTTTTVDRAYALRDYFIDSPFTEGGIYPLRHNNDGDGDGSQDLFDATANFIQVGSDSQKEAAKTGLRESNGWFIDFTKQPGGQLEGEKSLSPTFILQGNLFFSTFTPGVVADPCSPTVGIGKVYGVDALTGAAAFKDWGGSDDNAFETADRNYTGKGGGVIELNLGLKKVTDEHGNVVDSLTLIGTQGTVIQDVAAGSLKPQRTFWSQEN